MWVRTVVLRYKNYSISDSRHTLSWHLITILKNSVYPFLMTLYEQDYVAPSEQQNVKNMAVRSKA